MGINLVSIAVGFRSLASVGWGGRAASRARARAFTLSSPADWRGAIVGTVARENGPTVNFALSGIARDGDLGGIPLPSARVVLFQTGGDIPTGSAIADASGAYRFSNPGSGPFYVGAYKVGSPDKMGVTVNTLLPTLT